jgi:hypothetical protein
MQLVILHEGRQIKTPLEEGKSLVLGRQKDVDILVKDNAVSRRHLTVELNGPELLVSDLESRNGFKVGTTRQTQISLSHNGRFKIGGREFVFQTHDDPTAYAVAEEDQYQTDEITPVDAEFVPMASNNPAAVVPVNAGEPAKIVPVAAVVPVADPAAVAVAQQPADQPLTDEAKKKAFLRKVAIGVAAFFILIVIMLAMVDITPKDPIIDDGPKKPIDQPKTGDYLTLCENAAVTFLMYFENPKFDNTPLNESLDIIQDAEEISRRSYKAHKDISQVIGTFKSVGNDYSQFSSTQLRKVQTACSRILRYKTSHSTNKIENFSNLIQDWVFKQSKYYSEILSKREDSVKSLHDKGNEESLKKALKKIQSLDNDKHIYAGKLASYKKVIRKKLGQLYYGQIAQVNDVQDKIKLYKKAIEYDDQYKKPLQKLLEAEAAKKGLQGKYNLFKEYVEDESHEQVIETARKLMGTIHEKEARREAQRSKLHLLRFKIRSFYQKQDMQAMKDAAKNSTFKDHQSIIALILHYEDIKNNFDKALAALKDENYELAKKLFQKVVQAEVNPSNTYRRRATEYVASKLSNEKIAAKHFQKGKNLLDGGRLETFFPKAREQFEIAEKYQPGISNSQVLIMIKRGNKVHKEYLTIAFRNPKPSKATLEPFYKSVKTALKYLRADADSKDERKAYANLERDDNHFNKLD